MLKNTNFSKTPIIKSFKQLEDAVNSNFQNIDVEKIIEILIEKKLLPKSRAGDFEFILILSIQSGILKSNNDGGFIFNYSDLEEVYTNLWETFISDKFEWGKTPETLNGYDLTNSLFREYLNLTLNELRKASASNTDLYDFYILVRSKSSARIREKSFATFIISPLLFFGLVELTREDNIKYVLNEKFINSYAPDLFNYKLHITKLGAELIK